MVRLKPDVLCSLSYWCRLGCRGFRCCRFRCCGVRWCAFGLGLQLTEQSAGRRIHQADDATGRPEGQADHAAKQFFARRQLAQHDNLLASQRLPAGRATFDLQLFVLAGPVGDLLGEFVDCRPAPGDRAIGEMDGIGTAELTAT